VALAEDDESQVALGWQPSRIEHGFALADTVVTLVSTLGASGPLYSSGGTAEEHLEAIVQIASATCGGWAGIGVYFDAWYPTLILSPAVAQVFASAGWTKQDVRNELFARVKVPARWMDRTFQDVGLNSTSLKQLVADGLAPQIYAESNDPNRLVPAIIRPEWVNIIIAGDPARSQSRFFINNHAQGVPTHKVARLDRSSSISNR
jgi:hypothetical protein